MPPTPRPELLLYKDVLWGTITDPRIRARYNPHLAQCHVAITEETYAEVSARGAGDPDPHVRARCERVLRLTDRITTPLSVRKDVKRERQTALRRGELFDADAAREALTAKMLRLPIVALDAGEPSLRFWGADVIVLPPDGQTPMRVLRAMR